MFKRGRNSICISLGKWVKDEATIYASERAYEQFEGVGGIIYHLGKKRTTKRLVGASNGAR